METFNIEIDGEIGQGVNSYEYVKYLTSGLTNEPLRVNIASFGGSFSDGLKIYSLLKRYKGEVTTVYDIGMSASAATIIGCAGSIRIANENALGLIHKVLTPIVSYSFMNEDDIEEYIKSLEREKEDLAKMTNILVNLYMSVSKVSRETIVDFMTNENWLSAEEMLEVGLVTEIQSDSANIETEKIDAIKNEFAFVASKYNLPELPKQFLNNTKKDKMNLIDTIANWFKSSENLTEADAIKKASNLATSLNDAIKNDVDAKIKASVASQNFASATSLDSMQSRLDTMQSSFESMQSRLENIKPVTVDTTALETQIASIETNLTETVKVVTDMATDANTDKVKIASLSESIAQLKNVVGIKQIDSKKIASVDNGNAPIEKVIATEKPKSQWQTMGDALLAELG
jgi:ATP-dependent protease ClpP protease subunit